MEVFYLVRARRLPLLAWIMLLSLVAVVFIHACSQGDPVSVPKIKLAELEPFQSILGKVVFVNKGIYGGDLKYNCILKGIIRNITNKPYKNVYIIWFIYDDNNKLFEVSMGPNYQRSIFIDKVDYLDSKSESDFSINLGLYSNFGFESAEKIRESVKNGREEACIYIMKKI